MIIILIQNVIIFLMVSNRNLSVNLTDDGFRLKLSPENDYCYKLLLFENNKVISMKTKRFTCSLIPLNYIGR